MITQRSRIPLPLLLVVWFVLSALTGCSPVAASEVTVAPTGAPTSEASETPIPTRVSVTNTPNATATIRSEIAVCSPFEGWNSARLVESISNPFHPPALGSDDPHQGVDFSDLDPTYGYAREGLAIHAVLAGTVAGVIQERFPYGNALMIETPIDQLPAELLTALSSPEDFPTPTITTSLTCPQPAELDRENGEAQSIYLLYAHLKEPVVVQVGDRIACGQEVGIVGDSGNALTPHLHIEMRAGSAGQQFSGMAHYDVSASEVEMANYCAWRVGNGFHLIDPMVLIDRLP